MKMFSFSDKNKKQKSDILNFLVVCFLHIFLFFFLLSLFSLILRAHCWLHCFSFFFCFFSEFFRSFDFFFLLPWKGMEKKKNLQLNFGFFFNHQCQMKRWLGLRGSDASEGSRHPSIIWFDTIERINCRFLRWNLLPLLVISKQIVCLLSWFYENGASSTKKYKKVVLLSGQLICLWNFSFFAYLFFCALKKK